MRRLFGVTLVAAALALAGCGGDDEEEQANQPAATETATETPAETPEATKEAGGGETLALAAPEDGSLAFDKTELTAQAGTVTIEFDNPSSTPHAVEVEGNGVEEETETITQGKATLELDLKAGEYTFYCPVGNHRQAGMEGKLTVE